MKDARNAIAKGTRLFPHSAWNSGSPTAAESESPDDLAAITPIVASDKETIANK